MMLKLELEKLLEKGLQPLGYELGTRQYGESIKEGAAVDDVLGTISRRDILRGMESAKSPEEKLLHAIFGRGNFSDCQRHEFFNTIPFFRRKAKINGINLAYLAITGNKYDSYEPIADKIIENGEVIMEVLELNLDVGKEQIPIADIILGGDKKNTIFMTDYSEFHEDCPDDVRFAVIRCLNPLHQQTYSPGTVYKALTGFLEQTL